MSAGRHGDSGGFPVRFLESSAAAMSDQVEHRPVSGLDRGPHVLDTGGWGMSEQQIEQPGSDPAAMIPGNCDAEFDIAVNERSEPCLGNISAKATELELREKPKTAAASAMELSMWRLIWRRIEMQL